MARDPYQYFRVEARELLSQLGKAANELDKGVVAPDLIALMLRLAHTLKGAARVVKQSDIAADAHAIEDALEPFREKNTAVSRDSIDAVQKALDAIDLRIADLTPTSLRQDTAGTDVAEQETAAASHDSPELLRTNVDEMDVLFDGLSETSVQLATLRRNMDVLQRNCRLAQLLEEHWAAPRGDRGIGANAKLGSMIAELRGATESAHRRFNDSVEHMDRELILVREAAEHLRLLPASSMFVSLERTARDASRSLGKRIVFVGSGGQVRLDAQVFGIVQSALVQAVRNAVAHGIETITEREKAGKSIEGHVSVEVRQHGHQAVFVCRDDGRGIDLAAVGRAAQQKGLLPADTTKLGANELLQILLRGGLSTAVDVTQLAGRGIGLDVVREAMNQLRGTVNIRTESGLGTTLEIVVPVSVAAIDALIVETADRAVAIPLHAVKRTLRLGSEDVAQSAQGATIMFEGNLIPFAPLVNALRSGSQASSVRPWSAIVIEGSNARVAVGVERLRGTQNVVQRRLPDFTPSDPLVAGASLDAEGHPQLVLDPQRLVDYVCRTKSKPMATRSRRAPILVIDDSLTTRMLEQSILESAGYEVDLAVSAEDGLERARQHQYMLFLVDVEMPGMDGFMFVSQVKQDPLLRDTPAILVTSRDAPEDLERGRSVGAQGYIVKGNFDQGEFLEKIRLLVDK